MFKYSSRFILRSLFVAVLSIFLASANVLAQEGGHSTEGGHNTPDSVQAQTKEDSTAAVHGDETETHATGSTQDGHGAAAEHGEEHGGGHKGSTFDPHAGTWINPIARFFANLFGANATTPQMVDEHGAKHIKDVESIKYDYLVIAFMVMIGLATVGILAGKNVRVRPEGKATSLPNLVEAAFEGFRNYVIGIMGEPLARKYTPLIATYFFTILFFNYMGLIPGMLAPTANPNVPIGLALVAFIATHVIAIKEAGFKSWFMHFVGEPKALAFLNFPLHIIGEFIKPISLAIRLLCNVFGEEMVAIQLAGMAVALMAILPIPIPFQFPIMALGVFFGALQALVFSTLLAIYISILSTHHDDHDEHNNHGHVEHAKVNGRHEVIGHGTESPVA